MTLQEIVAIFDAKQLPNGSYMARCPAHSDSTPSLSISQGNNGNVVIYCHAGCQPHLILAQKGLTMASLWNTPKIIENQITPKSDTKKLIATYDYVDKNGKLLYQKLRYEPKTFAQRRPDPDNVNKFIWNTQGIQKTIYRLPQVLTAIKEGQRIFICEGEKGVHSAGSIGLIATCSSDGAGKWSNSYSSLFKNANVVIIPDNDEPGSKHAKIVEKSLRNVAKNVVILNLPDLPEKGDIYDFIDSRDAKEPQAIKDEILSLIPKTTQNQKLEEISTSEEFYYEKYSKEYLLRNRRQSWMSLTETQFKKELAYRGMNIRTEKGQNVSEADEFIIKLRDTRDIDYAAPLAGYKSGFYEMNGNRILVTNSPVIIEPSPGEWNTIKLFISGLLHDENYDQQLYLLSWLKIAYESLRSGNLRPGQAIAFCGPHNCGKSLLQLLITKILGGRSGKPYSYMTGTTPFNGDLFFSEHLCIEDPPTYSDIRLRRSFGNQLKQISGSDTQHCHAKHKQAITLLPFWRLTISINDEPENLMVLPPIDDSIEDKIMIFKVNRSEMPMPSETNEQRTAFWNQLESELPAFLNYLCNWQIPASLRQTKDSQRYGVDKMHHADILREIDAVSPEFRLLSIIDKEIFGDPIPTTWSGTAEALEVKLTSNGDMQHESRKLLSWNNAIGTYLGRLKKKFPDRFSQKHTNSSRIWILEPPSVLLSSSDT